MGQQFYVIRNNPAPNTEAFRAKEKRDAEKARRRGEDPDTGTSGSPAPIEPKTPPAAPSAAKRQQPKRQSRSQRKSSGKPHPSQNPDQNQSQEPDSTTDQGESA